jgi:hypothetical protein
MKIKFNWGTGIVLAMIVMIGGMIFLVSIALRQDYDLVETDYYQKSVDYQKHIDKVKNTDALDQKISIEESGDSLKLTFPTLSAVTEYSGEIQFYSPVEASRDKIIKVNPDANYKQIIGLKGMKDGRYNVKIDWTANKKSYYQEQEITVGQ